MAMTVEEEGSIGSLRRRDGGLTVANDILLRSVLGLLDPLDHRCDAGDLDEIGSEKVPLLGSVSNRIRPRGSRPGRTFSVLT